MKRKRSNELGAFYECPFKEILITTGDDGVEMSMACPVSKTIGVNISSRPNDDKKPKTVPESYKDLATNTVLFLGCGKACMLHAITAQSIELKTK